MLGLVTVACWILFLCSFVALCFFVLLCSLVLLFCFVFFRAGLGWVDFSFLPEPALECGIIGAPKDGIGLVKSAASFAFERQIDASNMTKVTDLERLQVIHRSPLREIVAVNIF